MRELKFEVKIEECVREIRPLGFVIEFQPESAVSDILAVLPNEPVQINLIQCELA